MARCVRMRDDDGRAGHPNPGVTDFLSGDMRPAEIRQVLEDLPFGRRRNI